tara:strand:+ start:8912 stop:10162 length:1251 start_codon:yes stop_codon:yes gene_type:complete
MNILAISTLFPTPTMPNHGIFVRNRLAAMKRKLGDEGSITVFNPIPTSPVHFLMSRYKQQQATPKISVDSELGDIHHSRYFALPGVLKSKEHTMLILSLEKELDKLHAQSPFTHIDAHWTYPDLPLAVKLAKKWGVPCSVTLRGMEAFYRTENDGRAKIIAESLGDTDKIISLSQEMASHADFIADTEKRTRVITNGVNVNRFTYSLTKEEARDVLSLNKSNSIVLLGVGSLIERKGFHHVIGSLPLLAQQNPDKEIHYYIIGSKGLEGDFEDALYSLAKDVENDSGGQIKVIFKDQLPNSELPIWYNAVDVFCLSSYGEGSPNVLTEALSCGCPAVATNVGAVFDIMEREKTTGVTIGTMEGDSPHLPNEFLVSALTLCIGESYQSSREQRSKKLSKFSWDWCGDSALSFINDKE